TLSVRLTNPELSAGSEVIPRETILIERTLFLWSGTLFERLKVRNYGLVARQVCLEYSFNADYRDLFEVRGMSRRERGLLSARVAASDCVSFHYDGLDKISRHTLVRFSPAPRVIDTDHATLQMDLGPDAEASILVTVACELDV